MCALGAGRSYPPTPPTPHPTPPAKLLKQSYLNSTVEIFWRVHSSDSVALD